MEVICSVSLLWSFNVAYPVSVDAEFEYLAKISPLSGNPSLFSVISNLLGGKLRLCEGILSPAVCSLLVSYQVMIFA